MTDRSIRPRGVHTGLRVVELATELCGEQLGRLLAEQGADVVKVEPLEGAPSRAVGPWAGGVASPDTSLTFWFYNPGKRSVALDLGGEGREDLDALLAGADVFLTTLRPVELAALGLDLDAVQHANPSLVVASVTPFGLTGPWRDRRVTDLTALAGGGPLMSCGYDDHTIPPIRPGGNQAHHLAAAQAHLGVLLALIERRASGAGQLVDTSMHEALGVGGELANPYWFYPRVNVQRQTARHAQPELTQPALFECGDGTYVYFALILSDPRAWSLLVAWLDDAGLAADLTDPAYTDFAHRQANFAHIQGIVETFFLLRTAREAYLEGQRRGLPVGPLNAPEEVREDEHLRARDFFVDVDVDGHQVPLMRSPIRISAFPLATPARPPRLGQHTAEVLHELREVVP
ncbi:CoA transferase [Nitriliruptoraceae bacterium ZYF776]|nr:CoA transferase [Profundirhabdus halotolerans]